MRTLIVDDEPVARQILREELEQLDDVEIVGEAADGTAAIRAIRELSPELVFLDLQMPGLSGFDVIRKLPSGGRIPMVVIVTAYDQHAIKAFEAGAIDYLLKPIGQDRLAQAVERAMSLRNRPAAVAERLANIQEVAESPDIRRARRIVARSGDEYLLLNSGRGLCVPGRGRSCLDHDREEALPGDTIAEADSGEAAKYELSPDPPESVSEHRSRPENEHAEQPAVAADAE